MGLPCSGCVAWFTFPVLETVPGSPTDGGRPPAARPRPNPSRWQDGGRSVVFAGSARPSTTDSLDLVFQTRFESGTCGIIPPPRAAVNENVPPRASRHPLGG